MQKVEDEDHQAGRVSASDAASIMLNGPAVLIDYSGNSPITAVRATYLAVTAIRQDAGPPLNGPARSLADV